MAKTVNILIIKLILRGGDVMHSLMLMRKYAEKAEQDIREEISRLEKVLEKSPPGRLVVANNKKGPSYYYCENEHDTGKRRYISKKNKNFIESLADKLFAWKATRELRKLLWIVNKFNKNKFSILDLADEFEKNGVPNTEKTVLSREQQNALWMSSQFLSEYGENDIEGRSIVALCGLKVRSKSEATIADILFEMGVTFKYEAPYQHKDGEVVYPDFQIIHPISGQMIIYEHFGRMGDSKYVLKNLKRIDKFRKDGLRMYETFLCTSEMQEKPLSPFFVRELLTEVLFMGKSPISSK